MDQAVSDFWVATRAILDETPVNATLTECPERSGREYETWNVTLSSYGGQRLRGFYTAPRHGAPSGKHPAMLAVPGYGGAKDMPYHVVMHGFAVLTLYPRAQGESIPEWDLPEGTTKLTYNVTDKDAYYYRAGYMDCVRGVDFLCERDEVDSNRIGMWSRSQGGGFTLATAALDQSAAAARGDRHPVPARDPDGAQHVVAVADDHHAGRLDLVDAGVGRVHRPAGAIKVDFAGDRSAQFASKSLSIHLARGGDILW